MRESNRFDKYKQWRQQLLDDSEGMYVIKILLLGLFIAMSSGLLLIFGGKNPYLYPIGIGGFVLGFSIGMVAHIRGHYLIITRSQLFKKIFMKKSALYNTGQAWKFWVMLYGYLFCALFVSMNFLISGSFLEEYHMPLLWIGVFIWFISTTFACTTIKCPVCGARWFWLAISKRHNVGWFDWLFSQTVCPVCQLPK